MAPYIELRLQFVYGKHSELIKGVGRTANNKSYMQDDNLTGTASKALGHMFGICQTKTTRMIAKTSSLTLLHMLEYGGLRMCVRIYLVHVVVAPAFASCMRVYVCVCVSACVCVCAFVGGLSNDA